VLYNPVQRLREYTHPVHLQHKGREKSFVTPTHASGRNGQASGHINPPSDFFQAIKMTRKKTDLQCQQQSPLHYNSGTFCSFPLYQLREEDKVTQKVWEKEALLSWVKAHPQKQKR